MAYSEHKATGPLGELRTHTAPDGSAPAATGGCIATPAGGDGESISDNGEPATDSGKPLTGKTAPQPGDPAPEAGDTAPQPAPTTTPAPETGNTTPQPAGTTPKAKGEPLAEEAADDDDGDDDGDDDEGSGQGLYEHFSITADKGQTLIRLDKYLTCRMEKCSRNRIQAAADSGNILVNGKPAKSSYKVKPLDRISLVMPYPRREVEIIPENIPLDIVYEDDDLLIVNKAAGMVVHPGHGNYQGTLVNALTYHLRTLPMFREGDMRAGLVHRIDKDTSGLLVIAKNELAHARLAKQFFDHTIHRRYVALVWGNFEEDEGTITGNIGRDPRDRLKMHVFADGSEGKHAVTHWRVLRRYGYVTLVECRLETGRTHQIRVHMAWQGHPLFNDARYGGDRILKGTIFAKYRQFIENCFALMPRQALHARSLGFVHPTTHREVCFESELPEDFRAVLAKWDTYVAAGRTDEETL